MRNGWTLIELMIVILIVGFGVSMAVPAFNRQLIRGRLVTETNALARAMHVAREAAVEKGRTVAFCAGNPVDGCNADWTARHWLVFVDRDQDGQLDSGEPAIASGGLGVGAHRLVVMANGPFEHAVLFTPMGLPKRVSGAFAAGRLRVCTRSTIKPNATDVVLAATGRLRLEHHDFNGLCPSP